MNNIHPSFHPILRYVFPEEVLEFFEITSIRKIRNPKTEDETLEITLEEKNTPPVIPMQHRGKRIISNGFHRPITLQHFPLQDKRCLLVVKRRRWKIEGAGTMERSLSFLPDQGLKVTVQFADFLKEAD